MERCGDCAGSHDTCQHKIPISYESCENTDLYTATELQQSLNQLELIRHHDQNSSLPKTNNLQNLSRLQSENFRRSKKLRRIQQKHEKYEQLKKTESSLHVFIGNPNDRVGNFETKAAKIRECKNVNENAQKNNLHDIVKKLEQKSKVCKSISRSCDGKCIQLFKRFLYAFQAPKITRIKPTKAKSESLKNTPRTSPKQTSSKQRFCLMNKKDKRYLRVQLSIWFPCIFPRPTLRTLEKALLRMKDAVFHDLYRFQVLNLDPRLTEAKAQRTLFRKELLHDRFSRNEEVYFVSSVVPECQKRLMASESKSDVATVVPSPSMEDFRVKIEPVEKLMTFKMDACNKNKIGSFINAEKHWRHGLMYSDNKKSETLVQRGDVDAKKALHMLSLSSTCSETYHVPEWFQTMLRKNIVINVCPVGEGEMTDPSLETKQLLECPTRVIISVLPHSEELSSVDGHIFLSVMEQENINCRSMNSLEETHSEMCAKLLDIAELSQHKGSLSQISQITDTLCLPVGKYTFREDVQVEKNKSSLRRHLPIPQCDTENSVETIHHLNQGGVLDEVDHGINHPRMLTGSQEDSADINLNKNTDIPEAESCGGQKRGQEHGQECESVVCFNSKAKRTRIKSKIQKTDSNSVVVKALTDALIHETRDAAVMPQDPDLWQQPHRMATKADMISKKARDNGRKKVRFVLVAPDIINTSNSSLHKVNEVFECCEEILVDDLSASQELSIPTGSLRNTYGPMSAMQGENTKVEKDVKAVDSGKVIASNNKPFNEYVQTEEDDKSSFHPSTSENLSFLKASAGVGIWDKDHGMSKNMPDRAQYSKYSQFYERNCGKTKDCATFCFTEQSGALICQVPSAVSDKTSVLLKERKSVTATPKSQTHRVSPRESLINFVKTQWRSNDKVSLANSNSSHVASSLTRQPATPSEDMSQTLNKMAEQTKRRLYAVLKTPCEQSVSQNLDNSRHDVRPEQSYETMCVERRRNYQEVCRVLEQYYANISSESVTDTSSQRANVAKLEGDKRKGDSDTPRRLDSAINSSPKLKYEAKSNTQTLSPMTDGSSFRSVHKKDEGSCLERYICDSAYKMSSFTSSSLSSNSLSTQPKPQICESPLTVISVQKCHTVSAHKGTKQTQTSPPTIFPPERNLIHHSVIQSLLGFPDNETELQKTNIRSCAIKTENPNEFLLILLAIDKLLVHFTAAIDVLSKYLTSSTVSTKQCMKDGNDEKKEKGPNYDSQKRQLMFSLSEHNSRAVNSCAACDDHLRRGTECGEYLPHVAQNCSVNRADSPPPVKENLSPGEKRVSEDQPRSTSETVGWGSPKKEQDEKNFLDETDRFNESDDVPKSGHASPGSIIYTPQKSEKRVSEDQLRSTSKAVGWGSPIKEQNEKNFLNQNGRYVESDDVPKSGLASRGSVIYTPQKNDPFLGKRVESNVIKEYMNSLPNLPSRLSFTSQHSVTHNQIPPATSNSNLPAKPSVLSQTSPNHSDQVAGVQSMLNKSSLQKLDNPSSTTSPRKNAFKEQISPTQQNYMAPVSTTSGNPTAQDMTRASSNRRFNSIPNSSTLEPPLSSDTSVLGYSNTRQYPQGQEDLQRTNMSSMFDSLPHQKSSNVYNSQTRGMCPPTKRSFASGNRVSSLDAYPDNDSSSPAYVPFSLQMSPAQQLFRDICGKINTDSKETGERCRSATPHAPSRGGADQGYADVIGAPCHLSRKWEAAHEQGLNDCDTVVDNERSLQSMYGRRLHSLEVDNRLLDPSKNYHDIALLEDLYRRELKKPRRSVAFQESMCCNLDQVSVKDQRVQTYCQPLEGRRFFERVQPIDKPQMCAKSIQVEINQSTEQSPRKTAQSSPLPRQDLTKQYASIAVQTCACISKPNRICLCGYLPVTEKYNEMESTSSSSKVGNAKHTAPLKPASNQTSFPIQTGKQTNDYAIMEDDSDSFRKTKLSSVKQKSSSSQTRHRNKKCQVGYKHDVKTVQTSVGTSLIDGSSCETVPGPYNKYERTAKNLMIPAKSVGTGTRGFFCTEEGIMLCNCTYPLEDVKTTVSGVQDLISEVVTILSDNEDNCTSEQTPQLKTYATEEKISMCPEYTQTCQYDLLQDESHACKSSQDSSLVVKHFADELPCEEKLHGHKRRPVIHIRYKPRHSDSSPGQPICDDKSKSLNQHLKTELSGIIQNSRLLHQQAVQLRNKIKSVGGQRCPSLSLSGQNISDCMFIEPSQWLDCQNNNQNEDGCVDENSNANSCSGQDLIKGEHSNHLNNRSNRTTEQKTKDIQPLLKSHGVHECHMNEKNEYKTLHTKSNWSSMDRTFVSRNSTWKIPQSWSNNKRYQSHLSDFSQGNKHYLVNPLIKGHFSDNNHRKDQSWNARPSVSEKVWEKTICRLHKYTSPQNERYFINEPSEEAYLYINDHFPAISRSELHRCCRENLLKGRALNEEQVHETGYRKAEDAVIPQRKTCWEGNDRVINKGTHQPPCAWYNNTSGDVDSKSHTWGEMNATCTLRDVRNAASTLSKGLDLHVSRPRNGSSNRTERTPLSSQEDELLRFSSTSSGEPTLQLMKNYWQWAYKIGSLGQSGLQNTPEFNKVKDKHSSLPCNRALACVYNNSRIFEKDTVIENASNDSTAKCLLKSTRSVGTMVSQENWYQPAGNFATCKDVSVAVSKLPEVLSSASCSDVSTYYSASLQAPGMSESTSSRPSKSNTEAINLESVEPVSHFRKKRHTYKSMNSVVIRPYDTPPVSGQTGHRKISKESGLLKSSSSALSIDVEESISPSDNIKLQKRALVVARAANRVFTKTGAQNINKISPWKMNKLHVENMHILKKAKKSVGNTVNTLQTQVNGSLQMQNKQNAITSCTERGDSVSNIYLECESSSVKNYEAQEKAQKQTNPKVKLSSKGALQPKGVDSQDSSHGIEELPLDSVSVDTTHSYNGLRKGQEISEKIKNSASSINYKNNLPVYKPTLVPRPLPSPKTGRRRAADRDEVAFAVKSHDKPILNNAALTGTSTQTTLNNNRLQPPVFQKRLSSRPEKLKEVPFSKEFTQFEVSIPCKEDAENVIPDKGQFSGDNELIMWWNSPECLKERSLLKGFTRTNTCSCLSLNQNTLGKSDPLNSSKRFRSIPKKLDIKASRRGDLETPMTKENTKITMSSPQMNNSSGDLTIRDASYELSNHDRILQTKEISSQWITRFLGCAEVVIANDEMVVIEGAYIRRPLCQGQINESENYHEDSNATTAGHRSRRKNGKPVQFRVVLSRNMAAGNVIEVFGTYSRQLLTSDNFCRWKFVLNDGE